MVLNDCKKIHTINIFATLIIGIYSELQSL